MRSQISRTRFPEAERRSARCPNGCGASATGRAVCADERCTCIANENALASSVGCPTAAWLLVGLADLDATGGFDETPTNDFQDVDLCLRLRVQLGGELVRDPAYSLVRGESATCGSDAPPSAEEVGRIRDLWGGELADKDPCYSPHLSFTLLDFSLRQIPSDDAGRAGALIAAWVEPDPVAKRDRNRSDRIAHSACRRTRRRSFAFDLCLQPCGR